MNRISLVLFTLFGTSILLVGTGCQSVDSSERSDSHRNVREAHASSHREAPFDGTEASPAATRHAHSSKFDGRLSRALEPEDIQSSRQTVQFQQQTQENPVIKQSNH